MSVGQSLQKRVDRDRAFRQGGIEVVVLDLLPVLDSVEPPASTTPSPGLCRVAEELEKITAKYGLEAYGEVGEEFDPQLHEAWMQTPYEGGAAVPTLLQVMQRSKSTTACASDRPAWGSPTRGANGVPMSTREEA